MIFFKLNSSTTDLMFGHTPVPFIVEVQFICSKPNSARILVLGNADGT